jgi:hypothetical protein
MLYPLSYEGGRPAGDGKGGAGLRVELARQL